MNWADSVKATALAALAGRKTTTGRIFASTPSSWNQDEAWLTRAKRPRDRALGPLVCDPATPMRHLTVRSD
ncbi:MAG: hypothetical protein WBO04_16300 [Steroidobacteraceae bacterium]